MKRTLILASLLLQWSPYGLVLSPPLVVAQVVIPVGNEPIDLAVGDDRVFVSNQTDATISVLDKQGDTVLTTIIYDLAVVGRGIGFNPATNRIYWGFQPFPAGSGEKLAEIDGDTYEILRTIDIGGIIADVDVSPSCGKVFITNQGTSLLQIVDVASWSVSSIPVMGQPLPVAVSSWEEVFVGTTAGNIYAVDACSGTVNAVTNVGWSVADLTLHEEEGYLYATGYRHLHVVNLSDYSPRFTVWGFFDPRGVSVNAGLGHIYVSEFCGYDAIKVIEPITFEVLEEIPVGFCPNETGICRESDRLYVANFGDGTVTVISDMPTLVANAPSLPDRSILGQNYPNPFNPVTTISYQLPTRSDVVLRVFDLLGREVATLVDELEEPGKKSVIFDGTSLASGIYVYELKIQGFSQARKLILAK